MAFLESVVRFAVVDEVGVGGSVGKFPQVTYASHADRAKCLSPFARERSAFEESVCRAVQRMVAKAARGVLGDTEPRSVLPEQAVCSDDLDRCSGAQLKDRLTGENSDEVPRPVADAGDRLLIPVMMAGYCRFDVSNESLGLYQTIGSLIVINGRL